MAEAEFRLYRYRWVVLVVFMLVNLTVQTLWAGYSAITGPAAEFFGVSDQAIGLLAMVFMIAFIPLSLPVSWAIDTYGFRKAVSLGAILMAVFGLTRGLAGDNYTLVLLSSIGIAIAQPFMLNAWTTVPAKWFSMESRATAVGLITLANLVGAGIGLALTPELIKSMPIPSVQLIYGAVAAASAFLFLVLAREKPPTPPCPPGLEVRALMLDGLKHALKVRYFLLFLAIWFIGMGIFNGVITWIEVIVRPRGFSPDDAGTFGALMLAGGLLGAVVIPALSDRQRKRQLYLALGFALAIPGLVGLTFANPEWALLLSAFTMGFFLVSAGPVGMQYATEVTVPTPEGTSNGLVQLCGQASVVFVYIMGAMQTADGSLTPSLILAIGLMVVSLAIISLMKDPEPAVQPSV
jgi:predicted MFS family arabinose efflux permease